MIYSDINNSVKEKCANRYTRWFSSSVLLVLLFLVVFFIPFVENKKEHFEASVRLHSRLEWTRRRVKNSECRLGGAGRYALNSTWSPDLGPPFGKWSCVKCTCMPVAKKRRIVAKVVCRNIKNECPSLKCEKPILPEGACCKICPQKNEVFPEDSLIQKQEPSLEDSTSRDFAVLLNGRTSQSPLTTRNLATGRIFLRRGSLHFSFVLSPETPTATNILFLDGDGNILEELEAQPTPYEVNNGRVCGSWTRVPRQYRSLLLKENMWVALQILNEDDAISGRIKRYKGVETEVFSSLLSPLQVTNETLPGGGTAILSVSAPSDSLHIHLVFNGLFQSEGGWNVPVTIQLVPSRALEAVQDTVILEKAHSDLNQIEILTTLGNTSLRLLTRGKVWMKVWSPAAPELIIEGLIIARATCNVYSSVLTSNPLDVASNYGSGWALLSVSNEGDFQYQIRVESLPSPVKRVSFYQQSKKKTRQVEDLTNSYSDGWANGTFTKPTYRDLDMLLRGRFLSMVELDDGQVLEGEFQSISATEALRTAQPTLLKNSSTWAAATAWVAVDSACVMHYDIYLSGEDPAGNKDPTWSLQLREEDTTWDPRLDLKNVTLEYIVTGREVAAHTTLLSMVSLTRLSKDISHLDLTLFSSTGNYENGIVLSGNIRGTHVPLSCTIDGDIPLSSDKRKLAEPHCHGPFCILRDKEKVRKTSSTKCIDHEKSVYEDGTTWVSPVSSCQRCMCTLGRIHCQDEPCPKPSCEDPVTLPGQCCPSCPLVSGSASERVCEMDKEFHAIGSFWHPFLAPKGFDHCVTCFCNVTDKLEPRIDCQRMKCPELPCRDVDAQVVEGSCCRKCPPSTTTPSNVLIESLQEDPEEDAKLRRERILKDGGCLERKKIVRKSGEIWLPDRVPKPKKRCIFCSCKDGQIGCYVKRCPRKHCKRGRSCLMKDDYAHSRTRKGRKKYTQSGRGRRKHRKYKKKNKRNKKLKKNMKLIQYQL